MIDAHTHGRLSGSITPPRSFKIGKMINSKIIKRFSLTMCTYMLTYIPTWTNRPPARIAYASERKNSHKGTKTQRIAVYNNNVV